MEIQYHPGIGFNVKDAVLTWGMQRKQVREALQNDFKEDDSIFDFSDYADDATDEAPLIQKRDIYHDLINPGDMVFLSYDEADVLSEFEYHDGISLSMVGYQLRSGQPVRQIADWFQARGYSVKENEPGNFFVPELKLTFASAASMGGNGNGLAYFYAASDVSHLMD